MNAAIAYFALFTLFVLNTVATNWFVYGLWPHSWLAFVMFTLLSIVILGLMEVVTKKEK